MLYYVGNNETGIRDTRKVSGFQDGKTTFIGRAKLSQIDNRRFNGAPDLVIEVVCPGSATIDRVDKFREYERGGNQWISVSVGQWISGSVGQ